MQVAEILSDLTSLRVCDHHDALALVTVNERIDPLQSPSDLPTGGSQASEQQQGNSDDNLRRAKELVELHYEIKARHADGVVDEELSKAREEVKHVLQELSGY